MATGRHLCGSQRYLRLRLGGLADDVPVTLGHGLLLADVRTVGTCAHDGRQFRIGASNLWRVAIAVSRHLADAWFFGAVPHKLRRAGRFGPR